MEQSRKLVAGRESGAVREGLGRTDPALTGDERAENRVALRRQPRYSLLDGRLQTEHCADATGKPCARESRGAAPCDPSRWSNKPALRAE